MIKRLRQHQKSGASAAGFTLIELLVVIVILGILAAVVVFAVRGSGDKGLAASVSIDTRTIRTAEEAFCANNGRYGSGQELVDGGFLTDLPKYHVVGAQSTGGSCNGWRFSMLPTEEAGAAPGTWSLLDPPPSTLGQFVDLLRMPDGSVVGFGRDESSVVQASVWDPNTGLWTSRDPYPGGAFSVFRKNSGLVVKDECGQICNKVFLKMGVCLDDDGCSGWYTFDPTASSGSQWLQLPRHPSTPTFSSRAAFSHHPLVQLRDNPALAGNQCADQCGKVLIRGGDGVPPELYDPQTNIHTPFAYSDPDIDRQLGITAQLTDGRVLMAGDWGGALYVRFFNPLTVQVDHGSTVSPKYRPFYADTPPFPPLLPNGDLYMGFPMDYSDGYPDIYVPQAGGTGSFRSTPPNCDPMLSFNDDFQDSCMIIGSLPDGRVLAYSTIALEPPSQPGQATGRAFIYQPESNNWTRTGDTPQIAGLGATIIDTEMLDPRTGPCGRYCNKLFVSGIGLLALYTP